MFSIRKGYREIFVVKNWPSIGIKIISLTAVLWEITFFSSLSSGFQTNLMATVPKNGCLHPPKTDVTQNHVKEKIIVSWIKKLFLYNILRENGTM